MNTAKPQRNIYPSRVVALVKPCREHFTLTLRMTNFPHALPGQFVQLLCRPSRLITSSSPNAPADPLDYFEPDSSLQAPMLRRPFSIAGLRRGPEGVDIEVMGRVIGAGTAWLSERRPGDVVDVLGPLGRGFTPPTDAHRALLVAGGVGLPPVRWWGEILRARGVECRAIYGAQTRDLLPVKIVQEPQKTGEFSACVDEFARDEIDAIITTDDGSCGIKGLVTDALTMTLSNEARPSMVYACGPHRMLEAVARICAERGAPCEVALERVMGCGLATCQSCVVSVADERSDDGWRYALCCTEGPVFDASRVLWHAGA